jgi:hypothetical protein
LFFQIIAKSLIYFSPGRVLDNQAVAEFFAKLESQPGLDQGRYHILVDHSQIREVALTSADYRQWALNSQKMAAAFHPFKVAIYSSTALGFGMARMFEAVFSIAGSPVQFWVFDDLDRALEWLELPDLKPRIISLSKRAAIPLQVAGAGNSG